MLKVSKGTTMLYTLGKFSETISELNEKLESILGKFVGNTAFGTIALFAIFAFGCWMVSYLNKK